MSTLVRFELRLLGGATLLAADGAPLAGRAVHRHRIALLALLALARPNGMSREKLVGLLWPERDAAAARHLLRGALHDLRQTLGAAALEAAGGDLHLDAARVQVDVHAFEEALSRGELERAVALYRGPFLDGLFLDDAEAFDGWLSMQRTRLARRCEDALEALAERAGGDGAIASAARWWSALAERRAEDGRVVLRTMEALAAVGERAAAIALAENHVELLRAEYGASPDAALVAFAHRLRGGHSVAVVRDGETEGVVRSGSGVRTDGDAQAGNDAVATVSARVATIAPSADVTTATFPASTLPPHGAPEGSGTRKPVSPSPRRTVTRRLLPALSVAALAIIGASSLRPRPHVDTPDALAVLPFEVVGRAPAELRDGLPELLSANLDQVTGLRIVPARVGAARARALGAEGGSATPGRVARALGSDAVVSGVVATAPDGLHVVASLVDAGDSTLARVEARGSEADLPALVDRVSVALLRELWGRRSGVPQPRLSAVSTTSPAALRAYLRGETFLRQALWDSAASALAQAVDLDSTFALAHMRLAEPYGWRYGMASAPAERALAAARRFADRLPPRERSLLAVRELHEAGDARAVAAATALADRYPDDPEARYVRADVRFHARPLHGADFTRLAALSFDSAAALDSGSARVWAHPITLAIQVGDRERFDRAVARLTTLTPGSHVQVAERPDYALLRTIRWSPPREALRVLVARLRTSRPPPWLATELLLVAEHACMTAERPDPDALLAAYDAVERAYRGITDIETAVAMRRLTLLLGIGRLAAARPVIERAWTVDPGTTAALAMLPASFGDAPPDWVADAAAHEARVEAAARDPLARSVAAYWRGMFALATGDAARARAAFRDATPPAGDSAGRPVARALVAAGAWARIVEGDTARGLRELDAALEAVGYEGVGLLLTRPQRALRTRLVAARVAGAPRADGVDLVRGELLLDGWAWAAWHRALAAALDAEGDRAGAAAARARYAALRAGSRLVDMAPRE